MSDPATRSALLMPVRRILGACLLSWLLLVAPVTAAAQETRPGLTTKESVPGPTVVELFVNEGCPHCAAARKFIDELARERRALHITIVEVQRTPGALIRLQELSRAAGIAQPGVPTLRIGQELVVGFDTPATTGARIRAILDHAPPPAGSAADPSCDAAAVLECEAPPQDIIDLPLFAKPIGVEDVGLPLFTIAIGLVDGFNPCSMWVLILMISMLANLHDRRKMLAIAGTFVAIQGLAYFAFMAAWLNLFMLIGWSRTSEIILGGLALIAGLVNLKDFVAIGRGLTLSIPAAAKPGIYARLRSIIHAGSLWPAVLGAMALAVMVQIVELLCTSGFPALYTRILTLRGLDSMSYYGYLLLYNAMYMLDDLLILGIGVATLSQRRLQEKEGRILKLAAGLVMVALGIYLLAR